MSPLAQLLCRKNVDGLNPITLRLGSKRAKKGEISRPISDFLTSRKRKSRLEKPHAGLPPIDLAWLDVCESLGTVISWKCLQQGSDSQQSCYTNYQYIVSEYF